MKPGLRLTVFNGDIILVDRVFEVEVIGDDVFSNFANDEVVLLGNLSGKTTYIRENPTNVGNTFCTTHQFFKLMNLWYKNLIKTAIYT